MRLSNGEAQFFCISSLEEEGIFPRPRIGGLHQDGAGFACSTIFCGYNCIIMYFTSKECYLASYTDAYETIKVVPIVQAATASYSSTKKSG